MTLDNATMTVRVHPSALVESEAIGEGTRVWAFAHILPGAIIGRNANIGDHAFIEGGAVIGDNVTVKNYVAVWDGVTLADDVFVGPHVAFTNDRYPRSPRMESARSRYTRRERWLCRTVVQRGCSIGANATILPGLTLGAFSFIAAGAVVTRDVPPFALMQGTPAVHAADVCGCGRRLSGSYRESPCEHCGEVPADRLAHAP